MRFLCLKSDPPRVLTLRELARSRLNLYLTSPPETWPRKQMEFGKFERVFDTPPPSDANTLVARDGSLIQSSTRLKSYLYRYAITRRLFGVRKIVYDGSGYEKRGDDYYQTWVKRWV